MPVPCSAYCRKLNFQFPKPLSALQLRRERNPADLSSWGEQLPLPLLPTPPAQSIQLFATLLCSVDATLELLTLLASWQHF